MQLLQTAVYPRLLYLLAGSLCCVESGGDAVADPGGVQGVQTLEHSSSGKKSFDSDRFDYRYRIDFFDLIRFANLINLPLLH